jgi:ResB-like family
MDETAIQSGAPATKPAETGILAGTPPGSSTNIMPAPKREPRHPAMQVLIWLADLRLTVTLFALALVLVFWGTLAQVDNGIWTVVQKYFRTSLNPIVWVPLKVVFFNSIDNTADSIPFPSGSLIGLVMLVNLLAAHAIRFKLTWSRAGIILIHAGIIIMMVGEVITGVYQVEGSLVIEVGKSSSTVIHPTQSEFAVIRILDSKKDAVVTIPAPLLKKAVDTIDHADVPFKIEVIDYLVNAQLRIEAGNQRANRGFGVNHKAVSIPEVSGVDPNQRHDQPAVYLKLTGRKGEDLGKWLFSTDPRCEAQWIKIDGVDYQLALRFKQVERRFTMHLNKFEHEVFPGTTTPKDFHSYIHLTDEKAGVDRPNVEIYMNTPLYYDGETFYQSSWTTDFNGKANGTVLQVVRNPGWLMPYVSCLVVGLGLLIHFGLTLYRFIDRRIVR